MNVKGRKFIWTKDIKTEIETAGYTPPYYAVFFFPPFSATQQDQINKSK